MQFVPHKYQQYCIERIEQDSAVGLFLDMGLGKTVITLTAIRSLKFDTFEVDRVLVIAPKKVAEATWTAEAEKWEHTRDLRVVPVLGSRAKRIRALASPGDVYVLSRDCVEWAVKYYTETGGAWPFDMVVIDELSSFKNGASNRFRSLKRVRGAIRRIVGLTGTPAPNGLIDLWAQMYLLDGGARLGRTISQYREMYFRPDKRSRDQIYTWAAREGSEELIRQRISDLTVSMKASDYLQLPPLTVETIPVVLDDKAQKKHDELEREALLQVDEETIDAETAAALTSKLLQLGNGAVYTEERTVVPIHDCKLEALSELIESLSGCPVLLFYAFRHDLPRIRGALPKHLRVGELKTPDDIARWNRREVDILLAHPASAAYGLNLQAGGNHVVWFGLTWSLELYQQANARLYRQGQTERVIIHHLAVKGGIDERVLAALEGKAETQNSLIDALKARIREAKGEKQ